MVEMIDSGPEDAALVGVLFDKPHISRGQHFKGVMHREDHLYNSRFSHASQSQLLNLAKMLYFL